VLLRGQKAWESLGPTLPDGLGDCLRRYGWEVDHPPYPSSLTLPDLRLANDGVPTVLHHTENYSPLTVLMLWPENSGSTALATDGYLRISVLLIYDVCHC